MEEACSKGGHGLQRKCGLDLVTSFTPLPGTRCAPDRKPWKERQAGGDRQRPQKDVSAHLTCVYAERGLGAGRGLPVSPEEGE